MALIVGNASVGDGMLSYELWKGVWGTASIVDVAGIQVTDGLVALRGRGQKNRTPGDLVYIVKRVCISAKSLTVEHVFMRVVRDCPGRDVVALLCPARTSVLEPLLRALGILEEF